MSKTTAPAAVPCACEHHDRPEIALARAIALAREVAAMIRGACADAIDRRARGVAETVARAACDRTIWHDRIAGPIMGLGEELERLVAASVGPRTTAVVVGHDEDGPIIRDMVRDLPDPNLVALRERLQALAETLDAVRDIVAADEAVTQMRRAAG